MKAVIINGANSERSRTTCLIQSVHASLHALAVDSAIFNLHSFEADCLLLTDYKHQAVASYQQAIVDADFIVIASPVYQGSFSGVLKLLLDLIPQKGLSKKKILPLATGGSLAHLLMLDYSLKPVLAALGATHILAGVFATNQDFQATNDLTQHYHMSSTVQKRLEDSLNELVSVQPPLLFALPSTQLATRQYA
jgi:FMN reductase